MISGEFSKLQYEKVYRLAVVVLIPAWPAWPPTCATVRRSLARGPAGRNGSRWASKVSRRDFRGQSPLPKSAQCWERAGRPEATAGLVGRAWCPSLGPVAAPPPSQRADTTSVLTLRQGGGRSAWLHLFGPPAVQQPQPGLAARHASMHALGNCGPRFAAPPRQRGGFAFAACHKHTLGKLSCAIPAKYICVLCTGL
jgi:hypothetical protein